MKQIQSHFLLGHNFGHLLNRALGLTGLDLLGSLG
jgi:hypothetical protein